MHITDIITSPWAIQPDKLREIQAVYSAHVRGEKIDIASVEAKIGRQLSSDPQGYQVKSGVAVIPISGVIGKKMNMMSQISGGASTQLIERDINAAVNDPNVNSILLHIDSPGGTVDGTQNLADVIRAAGTVKPVVAFADGVMASAAYWIGSAASEIVASADTTEVGSIGVVSTHTDVSQANERDGIRVTEISAGKYKRITSQHAPLSEEGAAVIQDRVDQIYTIFVDAVASQRGVDVETVLNDMADGRVFLAREAQARGMIDRIASMDETISNMSMSAWPVKNNVIGVMKMDMSEIKEKHPEIVAEIMQEGAAAERARIQGCEEATLAGHESLVASMKYDGKSTASDVALAIVGAEKKLRADNLSQFRSEAPNPVPAAPVPAVETAAEDDLSLPLEERTKAKWNSDPKIRKEFISYDIYHAFMKSESGNAH